MPPDCTPARRRRLSLPIATPDCHSRLPLAIDFTHGIRPTTLADLAAATPRARTHAPADPCGTRADRRSGTGPADAGGRRARVPGVLRTPVPAPLPLCPAPHE